MDQGQEQLELRVRACWERGDHDAAATLLIRALGPKVLAFLLSRLRDRTAAEEVLSEVYLKVWQELPRFQWRCRARTWFFRIARNTAINHARKTRTRRKHHAALSQALPEHWMQEIRTQTIFYLRTEVKTRLHERIRQLSLFEQSLLQLKQECSSWSEVAVIFHQGEDMPSVEEIKRGADNLKHRYCKLKNKLFRELAPELRLDETRE